MLTLKVADDGVGATIAVVEAGTGTGLRRLRERMAWLYGDRARLELASEPGKGFVATLSVPQS
jgi:signal transduction histidine kinase